MKKLQKVKYIWNAVCSDGGWTDRSNEIFGTLKECYNNMRDAALSKLHYNTEIDEMPEDEGPVYWKLKFDGENKTIILHSEICGTYTYNVIEVTNQYIVKVEKAETNECIEYFETPFMEEAENRFNKYEECYQDRRSRGLFHRKCEDVIVTEENVVKQELISWCCTIDNNTTCYRISIYEEGFKD
jgi:hypothetical protein